MKTPVGADQIACRFRDPATLRALSIDRLLRIFCSVSGEGLIELLSEKPKIVWWKSGDQSFKSFPVDWSYCAFQLKDSKNGFVIDENRDIIERLGRKLQGTNRTPEIIVGLLIKMGARRQLSDLSAQNLYTEMGTRTDTRGIQSYYRRILTALNAKIDQAPPNQRERLEREFSEMADRCLTRLAARKGNGPVELRNRNEIFYWDNITLSRKILDNCWKLEIGNRAGAPSVEKRLGVAMLDGSSAILIPEETVVSGELTRELADRLAARAVCLMAIRCRDVSSQNEIDTTASFLRDLPSQVSVVQRGAYWFKGQRYELSEGELIQTGERFAIRSCAASIEQAFEDPAFCQAVGEMLGIKLKLADSRAIAEIRNVAKSSDAEMDAIRHSDLSEADWSRAEETLGLGEEEKRIWEARLGRALSPNEERELAFRGSRAETIRRLMGMDVPEEVPTNIPLGDMNNAQTEAFIRWLKVPSSALGERTADKLRELRRARFAKFLNDGAIAGFVATAIHRRLETGTADERRKYIPLVLRFQELLMLLLIFLSRILHLKY